MSDDDILDMINKANTSIDGQLRFCEGMSDLWLLTGQAGLKYDMGIEMDRRLSARSTTGASGGGGNTKVRVRISDTDNLHFSQFSGDKSKDKEGFVAWRLRLEMHMDAVWPGLADVLEKIRGKKAPVTTYEFDKLVYDHGDQPYDAEPEDW